MTPRKIKQTPPPSGFRRLVARMPIHLYRWHLGPLMGGRFLLLTHTGRTSGQPRQVVLEVVSRDRGSGACLVASGFGPTAQWYRNVQHHPAVTVQIGRHRTAATARTLTPEESGRAMATYAGRRPHTARTLMRICGLEVDGTPDDFYLAGRDHIPFVQLTPDHGRHA